MTERFSDLDILARIRLVENEIKNSEKNAEIGYTFVLVARREALIVQLEVRGYYFDRTTIRAFKKTSINPEMREYLE